MSAVAVVVAVVLAVVVMVGEAAVAVGVTMAMAVTVAVAIAVALAMAVAVAMAVPVVVAVAMAVAAVGTSFTHVADFCFTPRANKLPQPPKQKPCAGSHKSNGKRDTALNSGCVCKGDTAGCRSTDASTKETAG